MRTITDASPSLDAGTQPAEQFGVPHPNTGLFLKSRLRHAMSEHEKEVLENLVAKTERFSSPHSVLKRGQLCEQSTMLVEGFMLRVLTEHGKRHIVGIQVPGDFVDLHAFALKRLDHDLVTIGPTKLAYVPHTELQKVMSNEPHLARLLWFSTLLDAAINREWIMKMQQLRSDGRVAHLLCEIWQRLDFIGLADNTGFRLPLTQADLADACGTTAIHMNRILRQLQKSGIAEFRHGLVSVPDRSRLEEYAQFDPAFLYGTGELQIGDELSD